jgi:hypothetical protein
LAEEEEAEKVGEAGEVHQQSCELLSEKENNN